MKVSVSPAVVALTGFTGMYLRSMNMPCMVVHAGDCKRLFTNSAGLSEFVMHLVSVFPDIVNTFSPQTSHSLRVRFMLVTFRSKHGFHSCNSLSTVGAFILLDTAVR